MPIRALYQGETYPAACEGGFIRRPAQEAGVLIENDEVAIFVPWRELDALRAEVQRRPVGSAPAGIRVRPVVAPKRKVRR